MKPIDTLAIWIMFQLLVIGFASGLIRNDCWAGLPKEPNPPPSWKVNVVAIMLPLAAFIEEIDKSNCTKTQ